MRVWPLDPLLDPLLYCVSRQVNHLVDNKLTNQQPQ